MVAINEIKDEWINQTFFKQNCTYGDDRHLTNLCLIKSWKIVYTAAAFGYTETPEDGN